MIKSVSRRSAAGFTLIELMIVIAIIAILAAVLVPNFIRARAMGQLTACKSNLKNLATSLEAYSVDNGARYPTALVTLTPAYIKTLPICPTAGQQTYTASFFSQVDPDTYLLRCEGTFHSSLAIPTDYPQYDSGRGLVERP